MEILNNNHMYTFNILKNFYFKFLGLFSLKYYFMALFD